MFNKRIHYIYPGFPQRYWHKTSQYQGTFNKVDQFIVINSIIYINLLLIELHYWCVLLTLFEYYTEIGICIPSCSCIHVTFKVKIFYMTICTNWQQIQCIIIGVIINILLNQTLLEINKMLRLSFKWKVLLQKILLFPLIVTLTDPSCTSVNKTWNSFRLL